MSDTTLTTTTAMSNIFTLLQSVRSEADLPLHILADRRGAAMDDQMEEALALASKAKNPVARQRYLTMAAKAGSEEAKTSVSVILRTPDRYCH